MFVLGQMSQEQREPLRGKVPGGAGPGCLQAAPEGLRRRGAGGGARRPPARSRGASCHQQPGPWARGPLRPCAPGGLGTPQSGGPLGPQKPPLSSPSWGPLPFLAVRPAGLGWVLAVCQVPGWALGTGRGMSPGPLAADGPLGTGAQGHLPPPPHAWLPGKLQVVLCSF